MYKIMIVDDEYLEREALSIILKNRCTIEDIDIIGTASNGEEAVELSKVNKIDIIFIDIKMPKKDGLQALKEIKKFLPEAKFVII